MAELRRGRGWSQDAFAAKAGLHRAYIGAVERGEKNLTLRTMKRLADALGVRVRDLVENL